MANESLVHRFPSGLAVWQERQGLLVIDAGRPEDLFLRNDINLSALWDVFAPDTLIGSDGSRPTGAGFIRTVAGAAQTFADEPSEAYYRINISTAGVYRVWVRRYAADANSDEVFLAVDGVNQNTNLDGTAGNFGAWSWVSSDNGVGFFDINLAAGEHLLSFMRLEAGYGIDKIILTQDLTFVPTGESLDISTAEPQTGWQTLVQRINHFFDQTNLSLIDAQLTRRGSAQHQQDQHDLYIAYERRLIGNGLTYQAAYDSSTTGQPFPTWFASNTDANWNAQHPRMVRAAIVLPQRDTQQGKQYFYIYTDKTTNPNGLQSEQAVFIGYPTAPIAAGGTGTVTLYNSEGVSIGNHTVLNADTVNAWGATDAAYVIADPDPSNADGLVAIPMCCP